MNKLLPCVVAVISNHTVCDVSVSHTMVFCEMKLFCLTLLKHEFIHNLTSAAWCSVRTKMKLGKVETLNIQKIVEILEMKRPECIIDCVAFFYVKGRLGEYYQPKNNFRSSARSEERRPSKLQNLQNINPTSQLLT